jgi:phytoene/squalene synthetase
LDQAFKALSVDDPILDIAARFWEDERYDAARICYRSMRTIDDLIDNYKAETQRTSEVEKQKFTILVNNWLEVIADTVPCDNKQNQLIEVIAKFQIPLWSWQSFAKSMIYDIHHNGFRTLTNFLQYAEGASVAPGSITLHLCGVVKHNGRYHPPPFNVREAARPGALFSYLIHIIRDFEKDQRNNLNYFAQDLMNKYKLKPSKLKAIAEGGTIPSRFRQLMNAYYTFAESYRCKTRRILDNIGIYLQPRYRLSLEIVYNLYHLIFERIDILNGSFTSSELTPSKNEVVDRINQTISNFSSTIKKGE